MIPQLPTDNLYKFLALSGIIILVGAWALFVTVNVGLTDAVVEAEGLVHRFEAEAANWDSKVRFVEGIIKDTQNNLSAVEIREIGKVPLVIPDDKFLELVRELYDLRRQTEMAGVKARLVTNKAKMLLKREWYALFFLIIGTTVGIGCATVGFSMWYTRVQVFQDSELASRNDRNGVT